MDSERWRQVDSLLQSVLERPPEERDAFLRQACGGAAALEREVRSLLASHQRAGSFLESAPAPSKLLACLILLSGLCFAAPPFSTRTLLIKSGVARSGDSIVIPG